MGVALVAGCALIAFGPSLMLWAFVVAKRPALVIIAIVRYDDPSHDPYRRQITMRVTALLCGWSIRIHLPHALCWLQDLTAPPNNRL